MRNVILVSATLGNFNMPPLHWLIYYGTYCTALRATIKADWEPLGMGNVCCGAGDGDLRRRQELLKEGGEFKKKSAFLGVLSRSERVYLQLNDAGTRCA